MGPGPPEIRLQRLPQKPFQPKILLYQWFGQVWLGAVIAGRQFLPGMRGKTGRSCRPGSRFNVPCDAIRLYYVSF
jgi:hypothetical protein